MGPLNAGASINRIIEGTEINYIAYLRGMARLEHVTWHETRDLTWFMSGLSESWLNRILRFQAPRGDIQPSVDAALDIFTTKNLPFQWLFGPPAHRIGLAGLLEARGGRSMGDNIGMAVDLSTFTDQRFPSEFEIRPVEDLASATDWRDVLKTCFGLTPGSAELFRAVEMKEMGHASGRMTHVVYSGGQPVSIGTLFLGGGVAGILTIATIPEARRQGLGRSATAYLLRKARSLDYRIGVLMASAMGASVYHSLGFRKTCDFYRYEFLDGPAAPVRWC